jgi:hypothetical protein
MSEVRPAEHAPALLGSCKDAESGGQYAVRYAGHEQRCPRCVQAGFRIASRKEPLKAQGVGNMLYGMQGMSSD